MSDTENTEDCVAQLQRERADFLNYKRRVETERAEDRERTRDETLRGLLPAIDDLERAMAHVPDDLADHAWVQGVQLARLRFLEELRRMGVERVGQEGEQFDPAVHEAVVYQLVPEAAEQRVDSVVRPGYRLGSRLLRPAQVVVAGPNGDEPSERRHDDGQSHRN